jgi:hypothetical protein
MLSTESLPSMRSLFQILPYINSRMTIPVHLAALYKALLSYRYWYPTTFLFVFLLRYIRVLISFHGTTQYRPAPLLSDPTYHISDITIIMPTTNLLLTTLHNVIRSVLVHPIPKFIIATGGSEAAAQIHKFKAMFPDPRLLVPHCGKANR